MTKVRPRDNEAQPGGAAQSFAVNVYVPISIESPGDVKEAGQDDAREGPSETPAGGATDSVADAVPDTTAENLARTVDAQTGKVRNKLYAVRLANETPVVKVAAVARFI